MMGVLMRYQLRDRRMWVAPLTTVPLVLLPGDLAIWLALPLFFFGSLLAPAQPTLFEAVLPVSALAVGVAKVLARLLLVTASLGVWVVTQLLVRTDGVSMHTCGMVVALALAMTLLPFAIVPIRVGEAVAAWRSLLSLLLMLGLGTVMIVSEPMTQLRVSFSALLTIVLLVVRRLPRTFALAGASSLPFASPSPPPSTESRRSSASAATLAPGGWIAAAPPDVARTVRDSTTRHPCPDTLTARQRVALMVRAIGPGILVASYGMALVVGALGASTQWFLWLMLLLLRLVPRTAWLALLPIAPTQRLVGILVLGPLALLLAFGVGANVPVPGLTDEVFLSRNAPSTSTEDRYYDSPTRVSIVYWKRARSDTPPRIISPWGESVEAYTVRVLGLTLFNPFSVRESSSPRMAAWQLERATQVAFGRSMTAEQIRDERPRFRTETWPMQLLQGSALGTVALMMVWLAWAGRATSLSSWRDLNGVLVGLPVFVSAGASVMSRGVGAEPLQAVVQGALLQLLGRLPESWVVVVLVALVPVSVVGGMLLRSARRPVPEVAAFPVSPWARPSE